MKIVNHTLLSIAVIAGRTAWQSFHKGGNYTEQTNDITKDDYDFLYRLFNKYKHLSVAEHIYFNVEVETSPINLLLLKDNYVILSFETIDINKVKAYITINLRTIIERKNDVYFKWFFDKFIKTNIDNKILSLIKGENNE